MILVVVGGHCWFDTPLMVQVCESGVNISLFQVGA